MRVQGGGWGRLVRVPRLCAEATRRPPESQPHSPGTQQAATHLCFLGFRGGGEGQTGRILKGEIISLLPVLGKMIRSQKCLLVTPFVERHFGTNGWEKSECFS